MSRAPVTFVNVRNGEWLCRRALVADKFWLRLRGLLGRESLQKGEGLYITPCTAVHMVGMGYAIDAIFLDKDKVVVGIEENLQPGKFSRFFCAARGCLELPAGTAGVTDTRVGDKLEMKILLAEA
jgi:uncharacterized membrane protein (UPF0127 family)